MKSAVIGIALFSALVLAGCTKSDDQRVVGSYKIDSSTMSEPGKPRNEMAEQMAQSISLELKADHTYALKMFMAFAGTWSIAGNNVELSLPTNQPVAKSTSGKVEKLMVFSMGADRTTLTMIPPPNAKPGPKMIFIKK